MENADLDKLCRQIYVNHRQALDLISARVGSPSSELVGRIQKWIKNGRTNGSISPPTKSTWSLFRPRGTRCCRRWASEEKFQPEHWMRMELQASSGHLRLYVVVGPTTMR